MSTERAPAPILFVRSLEQTATFYGLKLGFALIFPNPSSDASLIVICRGGERLSFREGGEGVHEVRPAGAPRWHAVIQVPDADALAADFQAHGVPLSEASFDRPGGLRGFAVADPDGHIVLFAHPKAPGIDQPSLAARQAATGMGWIAGSWIWVEAVGSAIAALP